MCDVGKCKQDGMIIYAAFPDHPSKEVEICENHWSRHCETDWDLRDYFKRQWKKKSGKQ